MGQEIQLNLARPPGKSMFLTGAGFTANFGAPLSSDMWERIFNSPRLTRHPRLKAVLRKASDFENFYDSIISGSEFSSEEKEAASLAVLEAYAEVDEIIKEWRGTDPAHAVNIYGVQDLISAFSGGDDECGAFFTLNQDLFVERRYRNWRKYPTMPGVVPPPNARLFDTEFISGLLDCIPCNIPDDLPEAQKKVTEGLRSAGFVYLKLHGSYGWKTSRSGSPIVIGTGNSKEAIIQECGLLKLYQSLFRQFLHHGKRRLFVMGYSFRDVHINEIIASAIERAELELFLIYPRPHMEFLTSLEQQAFGEVICNAVQCYFPYSLLQLFPADQSETTMAKRLFSTIRN